jgi:integrase
MVKRDVKGIAKITARGRVYWYAWRGGPRLHGEPWSPEFWASYNEAVEQRRLPEPGRFRALVTLYRASPDYMKLAPATKENWGPWLDRIAEYFDLSIAQFERPEKIRPVIRKWRNRYADRPRTADVALQVLSRVCSHAVDPLGMLTGNPCEGIKQLYKSNRSEIIWTESDIARIKKTCPAEIAHAIDLAAHAGLRVGDLLRLSWTHIGDDAIVITTAKSGHKREAIVPLYDALKNALANIPKRSTTVLTNRQSRPWSKDSFSSAFNAAKHKAGMADANLHFHDLRGTAATRFYVAGLSERVIAEILGWSEENVSKIIRRYVDRSAAIKATIRQLNSNQTRTEPAKPTAKPADGAA